VGEPGWRPGPWRLTDPCLPVLQQGRAVGIVSLGDLAMERDERSALADISAAEGNT
jgi:hypothetical protein